MAEPVTDPAVTADPVDTAAQIRQTPVGQVPDRLRGALIRYRVLAYTVGVGLVTLVCVGVPLQIWGGNDVVATVVGTAHGYLYMVYAVLTFDLARRARWPIGRTIAVIAAGTVPFLSFYAERRVTRWIRTER
jgi:integral membrane protein